MLKHSIDVAPEGPELLGIIGGSNFLNCSYFASLEKRVIPTDWGEVVLHFGKGFVFCQRHHANPNKDYTPPHLINKKAILSAFVVLKVTRIIAFGSVGSLKSSIPLGSIVLPDDYFHLWDPISFYEDKRAHIVPTLTSELRTMVMQCLKTAGIGFVDTATYVQTSGPRFETKAEIRFLADYCDVVGMTAAHEATLCAELKIPYALVCIVDNIAHGLVVKEEDLSMKKFEEGLSKKIHFN